MRNSIIQYLRDNQYVAQDDTLELSARLCGNWSIFVYVNQQLSYYLKLGCHQQIETEYHTLRQWHQRLPTHVLEPIHLGHIDQMPFYLQRACLHQDIDYMTLIRHEGLARHMLRYFKMLGQFKLFPASERISFGTDSSYAKQVHAYMPYEIGQHSDFTLTNIGHNHNQILIFDWEDFAKSRFPCLDLATFVMSLFAFEADKLYQALDEVKFASWLKDACACFELNIEQFLFCLPYALRVFHDLKYRLGYSESIILKVEQAIESSHRLLGSVDA